MNTECPEKGSADTLYTRNGDVIINRYDSKAFNSIDRDLLWRNSQELGIPTHLIKLMNNLYTNQEAMRTEFGNTSWFKIGKGVRQGCILFPYLFNLYTESIMRKAGIETIQGITIGERMIKNLGCADDTTLITENLDDLRTLINTVKEISEKKGLRLNTKKTKVVTTVGLEEFKLEDDHIEFVHNFSFLGSIICDDEDCEREIRRRLAMGRSTMTKLAKIMQDKDISVSTKTKLVYSLVFPVITYGSESWTLRKADQRRLNAFKMWTRRRLLRIP